MTHLAGMNFHGVTQIEIIDEEYLGTEWVRITILVEDGNKVEITLHFNFPHQREMFLEQIGQKVLA